VFELITNKTEDLTFMVHIFRVVEVDHSKVQCQDQYMILSRGKCWNNEMHLIKCDKKQNWIFLLLSQRRRILKMKMQQVVYFLDLVQPMLCALQFRNAW
jgi:hypothetical protein